MLHKISLGILNPFLNFPEFHLLLKLFLICTHRFLQLISGVGRHPKFEMLSTKLFFSIGKDLGSGSKLLMLSDTERLNYVVEHSAV